jgi:predicted nucleotidyltransferase
MMRLTDHQLTQIVEYFREKPIVAVYLFGSYARGDADEQSDVDVLLYADFDAPISLRLPEYSRDLKAILGIKVDIYLAHRLMKYAKAEILKECTVIHSKPYSDR